MAENPTTGFMKVKMKAEARLPDGTLTGEYENPADLCTKQLAQFIQCAILTQAETVNDTTDTGRSLTNPVTTTSPVIWKGTWRFTDQWAF